MWYTYVLESLKNGHKYVGYTDDLRRRFKQHNSGFFKDSYTNKAGPWKLIYYESYLDKHDATEAEMFYKSGYGREILKGKIKNYLNNK